MKYFLEIIRHDDYSFNNIIVFISYPQISNLDIGLNELLHIQDSITGLELFLISLNAKEILLENHSLCFQDFLFLATGSDRKPSHRFDKQLDVYFDDLTLLKASTCWLRLLSPTKL